MPSVERFLELRKTKPSKSDLPPKSSSTARRNVKTTLKVLTKRGLDPLRRAFVVDHDSSSHRFSWHQGFTPCLPGSRAAGNWITNRGRRMTKLEMMRLQGVKKEGFVQVVTDMQLGAQIGNAMSVNVLERLLVRVLPAAGLVPASQLQDSWAEPSAWKSVVGRSSSKAAKLRSASKSRRAGPSGAPSLKRAR